MEHGSPPLLDPLAACQQRIRELEQMVARQQEVIAAYQEQLAQAAEQMRLLKKALFGRRRERYVPSPDQKLLFVPENVAGLDHEAQQTAEGAGETLPPPGTLGVPRPRRRPRRRIEFPQFLEHRRTEYPLPEAALPCGHCGSQRMVICTHVTRRLEMEQAKLYVVEEVRPPLRPKSKLAEAVDYVLDRWDARVRYTSDGRIPIDNNPIERLLKPVAIGRKNWLFFGSEEGGRTAATLYTLV